MIGWTFSDGAAAQSNLSIGFEIWLEPPDRTSLPKVFFIDITWVDRGVFPRRVDVEWIDCTDS